MNKTVYGIAALVTVLGGGAAALFSGVSLVVVTPVVAFVLASIWGIKQKLDKDEAVEAKLDTELKLLEAEQFVEGAEKAHNQMAKQLNAECKAHMDLKESISKNEIVITEDSAEPVVPAVKRKRK